MESTVSRIAIVCALGFGFLLLPSTSPAGDVWRGAPTFRPAQGQEVVTGSYSCDGTVFTDDQAANVSTFSYVNATSGITSGFFGTGQSSVEVPADLNAMAEICEAHISHVLSQVPSICTLGPIERERGEFGNGASTVSRFDFSCQGTRDEVIGVIGAFSRLPLTARLP
jgi:hypothetical protein